ncbi:MAG TPA: S1C family serine protease [Candidatus Paceibacterota bacterium]|nr:S1C family serine protease [Candidatus Paceibacterota bacterium]
MEQLTKQQIVLLCLLVCFVSSIATGTVIVSLVDQAPPAISQTVNRVIERTIEHTAPQTPSKETVVVKDDEAVTTAIDRVSKAMVRITAAPIGASQGDYGSYAGLGVIITTSGKLVSRAAVPAPGKLYAHLAGGNVVPISLISTDPATGLSVFQADQSQDVANARAYAAAAIADAGSLKLGQTVVSVSGADEPSVATGIISSLTQSGATTPQSAGYSKIVASASAGSFDTEAILVNLLGEVVGMRDSALASGDSASFIPSNIIKSYATS